MKLEDSKDMAEMEDIVESGYRIMMSDKLRATDSSGASCTSEAFGTSVKPFEEGFEEALEEALDAVPSLEESLDEKCPLYALESSARVGPVLRTAVEALTADSAYLADLDVVLDDPSDSSSEGADIDGFVLAMGLPSNGNELLDSKGLRSVGSVIPKGGSSSGTHTRSPARDHLKKAKRPLASDRWLAKVRREPMASAEDASDSQTPKRIRSGKPMADGKPMAEGNPMADGAADVSGKTSKKEPKQPKAPTAGNGLSWQLSWRMTTLGPQGLQQAPGAPPDAMAGRARAPPTPPQQQSHPQPHEPQPQPQLAPGAISDAVSPPATPTKSFFAPGHAPTAPGANEKSAGKPATAPRAFSWQTLKIFSADVPKRDISCPRPIHGPI